jgi:hypothetical protein
MKKKELNQNLKIDYAFSHKFNLSIKEIICFDDYGKFTYQNSSLINGISNKEDAFCKLKFLMEKDSFGIETFSCHLRD